VASTVAAVKKSESRRLDFTLLIGYISDLRFGRENGAKLLFDK
jgi:hypothetical protein